VASYIITTHNFSKFLNYYHVDLAPRLILIDAAVGGVVAAAIFVNMRILAH